MSKVKIQGNASGTGVLTITAPNTSTDRTITLPDTTGTLLDENSSVPAANLTGTIADARFPATLPAASAANLTAIPAANITGTLPAINGANLTGLPAGGITEADTWYQVTEFSISGSNTSVLTNLSRTGTALGTGMTQSSGVFTFPSTGHWLVTFQMAYRTYVSVPYMYSYIQHSTNSGSSFGVTIQNAGNTLSTGSAVYNNNHLSAIIDVTNVSTHRVRFTVFSANGTSTSKIESGSGTRMTFIKLGET